MISGKHFPIWTKKAWGHWFAKGGPLEPQYFVERPQRGAWRCSRLPKWSGPRVARPGVPASRRADPSVCLYMRFFQKGFQFPQKVFGDHRQDDGWDGRCWHCQVWTLRGSPHPSRIHPPHLSKGGLDQRTPHCPSNSEARVS